MTTHGSDRIDAPLPRPPVVAVSGGRVVVDGVERAYANAAYLRAVERAGGVPLLVPPLAHADATDVAAGAILDAVDGLLLTGGEDVDPARYGAPRHPATEPPDPRRDATELALVHAARERRTPLLAICRGVQLLNVALGGTLVQDLPTGHPSGAPRDARSHEVRVVPGSRLAAALGETRIRVNSRHHQAPAAPGAPLRVVATAPDGVVEGLEHEAPDWWAVGVQWHPEELVAATESWDRSLFAAFVARCRERRSRAVGGTLRGG